MKQKKLIVGVTAVVLALSVGVAWAAWTVSGSGSGSAKAATATNITLAAPATTTGDLYPGFTGGDLSFVVTNPNNFPVKITAMTPGAITSSDPDCAASNITLAALSGLDINVPANATSASVTVADKVSMIANPAPECQGATFTVAIDAIAAASNAS